MDDYQHGVIVEFIQELWRIFPNKSFSELMGLLEYRLEDYTDDKLEEALKELCLQNM